MQKKKAIISAMGFMHYIMFAINVLADIRTTVQKYAINPEQVHSDSLCLNFSDETEKLYGTIGRGLRIAIIKGFVISSDYGMVPDRRYRDAEPQIDIGHLF